MPRIGTILPFATWIDPTFLPLPNLILLGVLVLLFRRLPVVLALYKITPLIRTQKEVRCLFFFIITKNFLFESNAQAMFTGYFGTY